MHIDDLKKLILAVENPSSLTHAARTAAAAVASLLMARLFRLPDAYWASISTLIVMQSTLGTALPISAQRFAGTLVGAAVGALTATYFPGNVSRLRAGRIRDRIVVRGVGRGKSRIPVCQHYTCYRDAGDAFRAGVADRDPSVCGGFSGNRGRLGVHRFVAGTSTSDLGIAPGSSLIRRCRTIKGGDVSHHRDRQNDRLRPSDLC